jgi:hypothetical protein
MNTYYERVANVKKSLAISQSKINLSFNAWSSLNYRSLLGIVAYWVDGKRTLKTALLGLRPLKGYTGSNIADALIPVIKLFDIGGEKIGAFQIDNATSNDTAMSALAARIPRIDVKESRLRCFGYVVNLVVKALLYGSKSSTLQQELGAAATMIRPPLRSGASRGLLDAFITSSPTSHDLTAAGVPSKLRRR